MLDPMTAASPYIKDPRVDAYLAPLPDWQREIFSRVRDLVHEADAEVQETIKRTVQPYFVLERQHLRVPADKDHVNVFLYDPIAPDPEGIITARPRATRPGARSATPGRADQRPGAAGDVPAIIAQQPGRRLAQARGGGGEGLRSMTDTFLADTTALLERTPRVVRGLLDGLPASWLDTPDTADGWTPRDVVGHLISAELDDWIPRAEMISSTGRRSRSSRSTGSHTRSATGACR